MRKKRNEIYVNSQLFMSSLNLNSRLMDDDAIIKWKFNNDLKLQLTFLQIFDFGHVCGEEKKHQTNEEFINCCSIKWHQNE